MIHIHRLDGCAPTPLAHYLKAIGILRLVAEQADPAARGWWDGERFALATVLDANELEQFFLRQYAPTPMLSPWNRGSGFYTAKDAGIEPIEHSKAGRFENLRAGIHAARAMLDEIGAADQAVRTIKNETKVKGLSRAQRDALRGSPQYKERLAAAERRFKTLKAELIPNLRLSWRGAHREWIDVALVLTEDGKANYPALLGTGGADGRLDFTNNFLQRLAEVFELGSAAGTARHEAAQWIVAALWAEPTSGYRSGTPIGQFLPNAVGGANSDNGPQGDSIVNPFDFILMLEGSIPFAAHATRRLTEKESIRAAAPFALSSRGVGYASASDSDEGARGEQWMPLWDRPLRLAELKRLLAEGRAQIGAHSAREPLDLARAIARLGTARGIRAFQRFGFIERNGQSNLAVPLGRFAVPECAAAQLACLDDLDTWLVRLRREARGQHAEARLKLADRGLGDALLALTQHPHEPRRWQRVLYALAGVEAVMAAGTGFKAGPIPPLRPEWVSAADDGSPELRLALALALQHGGFEGADARWWNSVRRHWLPLDRRHPERFAQSGGVSHAQLLTGPEVVMTGRRGEADAVALVERRLVEASQHGQRRLPLIGAFGTTAYSADLAALIAGEVDLDQTMALARALMALDPYAWKQARPRLPRPHDRRMPDHAWLALRLALLPPARRGGGDGIDTRSDPAIFRRLASGDAAGAVELALRRLRAAGIRTAVRAATVPPATARRWAAALAFPIDAETATRFLYRLDPSRIDTTPTED
jgi:CRISPR-associated protein Csx17